MPARPRTTQPAIRWWPVLVLPVVGLAASACDSGGGAVRAEAPTTPVTIPVSPLPASSAEAAPTTVTTVAPTTEAPTTTAAPTTTLAPTTTEAPTTTAAPTTTLAPNVEIVGASAVPIPAVGTGDGDGTRVVQERLLQLGFWNAGADGDYGHSTKQAVMAFQKYLGLPATGSVDETTAAYMTNVIERGHGTADTGRGSAEGRQHRSKCHSSRRHCRATSGHRRDLQRRRGRRPRPNIEVTGACQRGGNRGGADVARVHCRCRARPSGVGRAGRFTYEDDDRGRRHTAGFGVLHGSRGEHLGPTRIATGPCGCGSPRRKDTDRPGRMAVVPRREAPAARE